MKSELSETLAAFRAEMAGFETRMADRVANHRWWHMAVVAAVFALVPSGTSYLAELLFPG